MTDKKEKIVTTRFSTEEYEVVQENAARNNQNPSTFIRKAVANACNNKTDSNHNNLDHSKQLADSLERMLGIKSIVVRNRNKITDEVITDIERRLEELWDILS